MSKNLILCIRLIIDPDLTSKLSAPLEQQGEKALKWQNYDIYGFLRKSNSIHGKFSPYMCRLIPFLQVDEELAVLTKPEDADSPELYCEFAPEPLETFQ